MPNFSKKIVYLSLALYLELITYDSITVDGVTINYNDNDIYVTPLAEPIIDVRINGTSIGSNGVANIPVASSSNFGAVKVNGSSTGIGIGTNGVLSLAFASSAQAKAGTNYLTVIAPDRQHESAFYGLAKASGDTSQSSSSNSVGTYTDNAKQKIQNMFGITDLLSTEETTTATAAHALNSTFMMNGKLHRATAAIAVGDAVEVGTNCEVVKADEVFVKNTDYASSSTWGLVKTKLAGGTNIDSVDHTLIINRALDLWIKSGTNLYAPIVPANLHTSIYYGLSKLAGVDLANETVTVGTYPETSKTAIRSLIGAAAVSDIPSVPVLDVQVNGTSVLSSGTANIPLATTSSVGVVFVNGNGLSITSTGLINLVPATSSHVKGGASAWLPLVPLTLHEAVFYGLTKVAGVDLANETVTLGTYPETSKTAIQQMLGINNIVNLIEPLNRVTSLDTTELAFGTPIETVGTPVYVDDVTNYSTFNLTDTGWYIFARIAAKAGITVSALTTVTGAAGTIITNGASYIDVAIKFEVAAVSKKVTVTWVTGNTEVFIFKSTDLAVRNLDYRTTFYIYDIAPYATWTFALTTDTTFVDTKIYYKLINDEYVLVAESEKYTLTSDSTFDSNKTYYTENNGVYSKATVTSGDAIAENTYYVLASVTANTYYTHSKITFSGMIRNVTYRLNQIIDCPIEIVLPVVPDDGYGAWFEIQMQYDASYSTTLLPTDNTVKIGTANTLALGAGINIIDLQYSKINNISMWTLLNTHSNIPTT